MRYSQDDKQQLQAQIQIHNIISFFLNLLDKKNKVFLNCLRLTCI